MYDSNIVQLDGRLEYIIEDVNDLGVSELYLLLFDVIDEMSQISILLIFGHDSESMVHAFHVVPEIYQLRVVLAWVVN